MDEIAHRFQRERRIFIGTNDWLPRIGKHRSELATEGSVVPACPGSFRVHPTRPVRDGWGW